VSNRCGGGSGCGRLQSPRIWVRPAAIPKPRRTPPRCPRVDAGSRRPGRLRLRARRACHDRSWAVVKAEVTRTSIRVRTAMAAQTRDQGRYLGGRPPYGYRLADAGPHPNKAHAAWGRRAYRLEPDPQTAPVVRWIFAQRLAGQCGADRPRPERGGHPVPVGGRPGAQPAPVRLLRLHGRPAARKAPASVLRRSSAIPG
jgi:hypothetical protein